MEHLTQFRAAFNGFNRQDVVRYLEYINNKHSAKVAQLNSELESLRAIRQDRLDAEETIAGLTRENQELREQIARLEAEKAEAAEKKEKPAQPAVSSDELEAYRRAERVERRARARAKQIGDRAGSALADVTARVDSASVRIAALSGELQELMTLLQDAMEESREAFSHAASDLDGQDE